MDKYYTPREAAETFNLKEKTLKDWLRAGKVRGEKIGRSWRIADSELRQYLKLDPVIITEEIYIDDSYIQSELIKIQQLLLDVDSGKYKGMSKGNALTLAGQLEDVIDYLEKRQGRPTCKRNECSSGQRMTRKLKPDGKLLDYFINDYIDIIIDNLLYFNGGELEILNQTTKLQEIIDYNLGERSSIPAKKVTERLQSIIVKTKEYINKDREVGVSVGDGLRLAAEFRYLSQYIDQAGLNKIVVNDYFK